MSAICSILNIIAQFYLLLLETAANCRKLLDKLRGEKNVNHILKLIEIKLNKSLVLSQRIWDIITFESEIQVEIKTSIT